VSAKVFVFYTRLFSTNITGWWETFVGRWSGIGTYASTRSGIRVFGFTSEVVPGIEHGEEANDVDFVLDHPGRNQLDLT
jgi:hypothetical protein